MLPTATPRTPSDWCTYFARNDATLLDIPWSRGADVTPEELAALTASLRQFQLGESSEGRNLLRAAADYANRIGDPAYRTAIRNFVAEEHRHARDLGRFLTTAGVPLLRADWTDGVFRRLRRLAGLEAILCILLVAELIANVYYRAIRAASRSATLRTLCTQLLRDERMHVRFHLERLAILRQNRSRLRIAASVFAHRVLFTGTCLVVWAQHRRALRAGGYGLRRFRREVAHEFRTATRLMDPRTYACATPRAATGQLSRAAVA
jgi:hypothetical protein